MSPASTEPSSELIRQLSLAPLPSLAMLAGMQLDVFTALADGPRAADGLVGRLGPRGDRIELLLFTLVAANLLEHDGGTFSNTPVAARFLSRTSPAYMGDVHVGLVDMWHAALQTAETIRTGVPQAQVDFATMSAEDLEKFYHGFYGEALTAGRDLASRHDFSTTRSLVDVGGGSGGLSVAVTEKFPDLRATVADLPGVIPITEQFLAREGAVGRVRAVAADVVAAPPPGTYDVAVLRALLQVLSAEDARRAVANVAAALAPGSRIFILGRILDDSRLSPLPAVLSNLIFLNFFPEGQAYTESAYREWLEEAGFVDVVFEITPDGRGSVQARKP